MAKNLTPDQHPRRTRSGFARPGRGGGNGNGHPGRRVTPLTPAERRRLRRDRLLGRRRPTMRRHHRALRVILICITLLSTMGLAGIGTLYVGYNTYLGQLPDAATLAGQEPALDSHVYARDGTLLKVISSEGSHHLHAPLASINWFTKRATIDIEDRHFYENGSWDLPRIVKAGWGQLRHDTSAGGASTITEQLAKISFLEDTGTLSYKIKEFILGTQIEANFSKDQILEMYLNRVAYGNHAVGIETAAVLYFQKHAKDLDLAEAAMLAGLPNSPTMLNPLVLRSGETYNHAAKNRQIAVLQAMVYNGDITQAQSDAAQKEKLTFHSWTEAEPNVSPDFQGYVESYLSKNFGGAYQNPGGWEIYTTLDLPKQALADKTVHDQVASQSQALNMQDGALVTLDPRTGEVLAMTGAWDHNDPKIGQLNMAVQPRPPGSTMKLFTYSALLATRKYTMMSQILDARTTFPQAGGKYTPDNYDKRFQGWCTLALCFGNSRNIPAVKAEMAVGVPTLVNLMIASGLTSLETFPGNVPSDASGRPNPDAWATTLGSFTYGISPLELADGAAMLADLGVHHDPSPVLKIVESASGRVLYQFDPNKTARRVLPENVAFIVNEITSNDHNRQRDFGAHGALTLGDRRVSAKTGTTDGFRDNWTVGWTPDLITATWVGNPDNTQMNNRLVSGITGAAPLWHQFMTSVLAGTPVHWFARPSDVYEIGSGDDGNWFLPGTSPSTGPFVCEPAPNCGPAKPNPTPAPGPTPPPGPPLPG